MSIPGYLEELSFCGELAWSAIAMKSSKGNILDRDFKELDLRRCSQRRVCLAIKFPEVLLEMLFPPLMASFRVKAASKRRM